MLHNISNTAVPTGQYGLTILFPLHIYLYVFTYVKSIGHKQLKS